MDYEQESQKNREEFTVEVPPEQYNISPASPTTAVKKSPAIAISVIALILIAALTLALVQTAVYFNRKNQELSAEYEQRLHQLEEQIATKDTLTNEQNFTTQVTLDKESYELSAVVANVTPSVVCVQVTVPSQTVQNWYTQYQTQALTSTGSGVIWSEDGYIITNQHVVEYAQSYKNAYITILFNDGTEADATLIAADAQTDLALLKVNKNGLSSITLGSSQNLVVGQTAIAIGNPLGVEYANSVTVGIVSGLNRQVSGENGVSTMIQTDAAVNPGNSGGALVDATGKLIGVVSAKIASTDVEGIGFAIPIDDAISILTSLKNYGYVKDRPATGIAAGTEITSAMARRYGLPEGFYITEITSNSAAESAGLRLYDVLLTFDGTEITTLNEIEAIKKNHKVGDQIKVTYYRNGSVKETTLTLTEDKG